MFRYWPITISLTCIFSCSHVPELQETKDIQAIFPIDNVVFAQSASILEKDLVPFVVEVPASSIHKYELRSSTGSLINDRELCPRKLMPGTPGYSDDQFIHGFPANYGISPGKFNQDGDPLDLVVLGQDEVYQQMISQGLPTPRNVRVVGLMKMEECSKLPCKTERSWSQDWKVLAVDPEDQNWGAIKELKEIPQAKRDELAQYWANYKGHQEIKGQFYSHTRVAGFESKEKALKFFKKFKTYNPKTRQSEEKKCDEIYRKMSNANKPLTGRPQINHQFLECMAGMAAVYGQSSREYTGIFTIIHAC